MWDKLSYSIMNTLMIYHKLFNLSSSVRQNQEKNKTKKHCFTILDLLCVHLIFVY